MTCHQTEFMSHKQIKIPTYLEQIDRLYHEQLILQQPGVHHIRVAHDEWCALLRGAGECNCNPDVTYIATEGQN